MNKTSSIRTSSDQEPVTPHASQRVGFFDHDPAHIQHNPSTRSRIAKRLLEDFRGADGKPLTGSERKQLRKPIEEWLEVGYRPDELIAAMGASSYKTGPAVGGQLHKSARRDTPKSWDNISGLLDEALEREDQ